MAFSGGSLTNDEVKHRIVNIYTKFVTDVDPDSLCDWLVQESVLTLEQSKEIRCGHRTQTKVSRALLDFLFSTQHPRAFLVVREALSKQNSYLLNEIDKQESGRKEVDPLEASNAITGQEQAVGASTPTGDSETEFLLGQDNRRQYGVPEAAREQPKIKQSFIRSNMRNIAFVTTGLAMLTCVIFITVYVSIESHRCISGPTLVYTIRTQKNNDIEGITILEMELFVVSSKSSEVEVYDSLNFSFSRKWSLGEIRNPVDMVSCSKNKCLYIMDDYVPKGSVILRVDGKGNLIKKWLVSGWFGRLSVTHESNIIFINYLDNRLTEYSPDGSLIREISLSSAPGINHPLHAAELRNGNFVVSHGYDPDELHRVCIVNANGKLLQSFGGKRGSGIGQLDTPFHLSLDKNEVVMVADQHNGRVVLLDQDLKFNREVISKDKHGLRQPFRILLDEANDRLFVADEEKDNVRIAIFDLNICK